MRLHEAEQIYFKPWLITPSAHASIVANAGTFEANEGLDLSAFFVQREAASLDVNGIGHVYVKGVIGQGLSSLEKSFGNTDVRDIQAEITALVAQEAKGILLCIDSPGGVVTGTPELAEVIAEAALSIPVFVFSDSQICSAAYWIAAGASRIIATDSAEIGSIGVYLPWIDRSVQWENEGIKADPVVNTGGNLKGIGFAPALSPEHRTQLQTFIDRVFSLFRSFVVNMRAMNEAVVPDMAMQGQAFLGIDALDVGLIDQIGSKEEAYEALLQEVDMPEVAPEPETDSPTDSNPAAATPANDNADTPATS